jgi:taurine dioxygenase
MHLLLGATWRYSVLGLRILSRSSRSRIFIPGGADELGRTEPQGNDPAKREQEHMNPILSEHLAEGVKLDVFKLSPHIGTEVRGLDLSRPLDVTTINALHTIWLDRALLIFRRQKLDQEALVRFTRYFGQAGERTASTNTSYAKKHIVPEIMLISNVRENGEPIGALPDGELHFHHDMIQTNVPHKASLLYALEVPSYGGDTCFASGYAAYDTLDPNVKAKLEGKRVCNTYQYGTTKRGDLTGALNYVDHSLHPAFRTHEETRSKGHLC